MMNNKGLDIGIGIIILLTLGLILLIVFIPIITQKIPEWTEKAEELGEKAVKIENNCAAQGYVCTAKDVCDEKGAERSVPEGSWFDCKPPSVCCKII
ncbi:hypothetical protein HYV79_04935 [Candidatus Woesearchaeota archaeon]|nr:hypothetical protein [Candidatus Woesearchaeota archaeon]